jgi:hypothetical protein
MSLQRFGGASIRANAERVVAIDLHQVGGLIEYLRDGLVFQAKLPVRNCTPSQSCYSELFWRAQLQPALSPSSVRLQVVYPCHHEVARPALEKVVFDLLWKGAA